MTDRPQSPEMEAPSSAGFPVRYGQEWGAAQDTASRVAVLRPAIALFGQFGCGNFGNEGSLEAMVGLLRRDMPQARLLCIAVDPQAVCRQHGIAAIAIGSADSPHGLRAVLDRRLRGLLCKAGN
ncbi:MAG TPA: hypothetical protein VF632_02345, partial [Longimicrobium sp.]